VIRDNGVRFLLGTTQAAGKHAIARRKTANLARRSAEHRPPLPIVHVGDEHVELAIASAVVRVVGDVNRRRRDHAASGVDELQSERVSRLVVASELGLIATSAVLAGNRLGKQPEDVLNEFITHTGAKTPVRSAKVGLDALEVGPSNDDAVQLEGVTHESEASAKTEDLRSACSVTCERLVRVTRASAPRISLSLDSPIEIGLLRGGLRRRRGLTRCLFDLEAELLFDELPYLLEADFRRKEAHIW